MDYKDSQGEAMRIALKNGRQKLLSIIDNDEDNGVARFASGGSVFTPRGTDTVPAMLTPGEFVMKKSAVDKYGASFMSSVNNGNVRGFKGGGIIEGESPEARDKFVKKRLSDDRRERAEQRSAEVNEQLAQNDLEMEKLRRGRILLGEMLKNVSKNAFEGLKANYGFATGGSIPGSGSGDTVPAMLTPGEFVMKKSAVDKYGVGFMRGINNGVQGFAKGGPVQYLSTGSNGPVPPASGGGGGEGGFGEMVSSISSSLDAFNKAFLAFSGLSTMLGNIINSISNLNITHTINLQGALNIPGFSKEAIDNIVTTITDQTIVKTDEQIRNALSQLNIDNDNRADA